MTELVTGDFWTEKIKGKPKGVFDIDAKLDMPVSWKVWREDDPLDTALLTADGHGIFNITIRSVVDDVVIYRIELNSSAVYELGEYYTYTLEAFTASGQHDRRTFSLKLIER